MFIPQDVFDASALTVAMGAYLGINKQDIANRLSKRYSDDHLVEDLVKATDIIQEILPQLLQTPDPTNARLAAACKTISKAVTEFHANGKRRSRWFRGEFFNKQRVQIADKVEKCRVNIIAYHFMVVTGTIDHRFLRGAR